MATATRKATGFKVPCPLCGAIGTDEDDGLTVDVGTLALKCQACSEEVSVNDLETLVADTERLIRWLAAAGSI